MADHLIAADETGHYEFPIAGDTKVTIDVEASYLVRGIQILVHQGERPVYAAYGPDVTVGDPKATMIPPLTWGDLDLGPRPAAQVSLISAAPAIVSVYRS